MTNGGSAEVPPIDDRRPAWPGNDNPEFAAPPGDVNDQVRWNPRRLTAALVDVGALLDDDHPVGLPH